MDFTNDDIASLGDKLAALDLTDGEAEALRTLVAIAADAGSDDDEVSGFAETVHLHSKVADFGSLGVKLGAPKRADGFIAFGSEGSTFIAFGEEATT